MKKVYLNRSPMSSLLHVRLWVNLVGTLVVIWHLGLVNSSPQIVYLNKENSFIYKTFLSLIISNLLHTSDIGFRISLSTIKFVNVLPNTSPSYLQLSKVKVTIKAETTLNFQVLSSTWKLSNKLSVVLHLIPWSISNANRNNRERIMTDNQNRSRFKTDT